MTEVIRSPAVEFANRIAQIAEEESIDFSVVFNGLAIATAAYLLDYTISLDGVIQEGELKEAVVKYKEGLDSAVAFASEQVQHLKIGGTD